MAVWVKELYILPLFLEVLIHFGIYFVNTVEVYDLFTLAFDIPLNHTFRL